MDRVIGYCGVDLDARNLVTKTQETNLGSMVCDLLRTEYLAEVGLYSSGSFRKNAIIPAGPISLKTIQSIFPWNSPAMVLKVSGAILLEALNRSVD